MRRWFKTLAVLSCLGTAYTLGAQQRDRLSINGYTSFEFEKLVDSEGNGDSNGSFDADLFDLVFNFYPTDNVRVAADITWEHGTATEDGLGNAAIEYGFVEYALSDLIKIRVGKMFTPFGIFNEIHTAKPAFLSVKEPASTNKAERIIDGAFRFFPRWGVGVALHGDGVLVDRNFSYDVLIANGDQEATNPFEEDNNGAKAVTGRFRFEPTDALQIGTSFYHDKIDFDGTERIVSEGLELRYQGETVRFLAELVTGQRKPTEGDSVHQLGWMIQPSYHFDNGITPYLRMERVDPDLDVSSDHGYDFVFGVNFEISPGFMVKAENNYYRGAENSTLSEFPGHGYNEVKMAVVLGF